jgi:tRNA-splicing ligase RtcB
MPDAHWGYGFPIGGVAAFDPGQEGIISIGGVGYDISCGVRTMRTGMKKKEVEPFLKKLIDTLFQHIPAGLGSEGHLHLSQSQLDDLLKQGASWAISKGYGLPEDLEYIEDKGRLPGADPSKVSKEAKKRQKNQTGTLGSGNHYLEIQCVDTIFDHFTADHFEINEEDILISLHCGSRALGHQIGTDYLTHLGQSCQKHHIYLPERDLVCAPICSQEGQDYYQAMCCGVNCALANRQVLGHKTREIFTEIFPNASLSLLYDVSHNTCKIEEHKVGERVKQLYVHRKGATRAFGPYHPDLPLKYRPVGQPVLIGGTMGTSSYILAGNEQSEELAWSSACHGAGRSMSRRQALKRWKGNAVIKDLSNQGILVRAASKRGAAEEAPLAYKNIHDVVETTHQVGLARKVAKLRPLACIKG